MNVQFKFKLLDKVFVKSMSKPGIVTGIHWNLINGNAFLSYDLQHEDIGSYDFQYPYQFMDIMKTYSRFAESDISESSSKPLIPGYGTEERQRLVDILISKRKVCECGKEKFNFSSHERWCDLGDK